MADNNTLNIIIDPSGASRGAGQTVNAINSIVNASNDLNVQINVVNNNLDTMGRKADRTSSLLRKIQSAWILMKASMVLYLPIHMLDQLIDKMIAVDRSYQNFMASMYVSTSSIEKSKQAFEFVAGVARAYGVELETISKSYAKFRAAVSGILPTAAIDRLFISVSAVSSVLHLAPQSVDRMFTAFTQMASKGQVMSEELKQQLGEHLPGAVALAAQAMGVSVKELMDLMKKGKVDIQKFFTNMPEVLMKKFGEAAKISSMSIIAQINNLKSTIYRNFVELNNSGAALGLATFIQSVDTVLQPTSEHFKVFGKVVGEAFLKAADFVKSLTPEDIAKFATQLVEAVSALIQLVAWLTKAVVFIVQHGEAILNLTLAYFGLRAAVMAYSLAAAGSVVGSSLAAKGLGVLGAVGAVVAAFFVGWQIGTVLKEKFLSVELFGIALAKKLHQIIYGFTAFVSTIFSVLGASVRTMAQGVVNTVWSLSTSIANLIPGINLSAPKVDFGADESMKAARDQVKSIAKEYADIGAGYDALADDAIAKRIQGPSDRVDQLTSKYGTQIEQITKLNADFEKLKEEASKFSNDLGAKSDDGKAAKEAAKKAAKQTRDFISYINEVVDNYKKAYTDKMTEIDRLVESESMGPTVAMDLKIQALKKYTSSVAAELQRVVSIGNLNAKQRADIEGKVVQNERFYTNELLKIQNEYKKAREAFSKEILDLEESIGIARLTKLDKFVNEWNEKNSKLYKRAQLDNDTESLSRLDKVAAYGVARNSYKPDLTAGVTEFQNAADIVKDYPKLFTADVSTMLRATLGEYDEYFKDIAQLRQQDSISEQMATNTHNNLMLSRSLALREAAISAGEANVKIGAASNLDSMIVLLGKLSDGFVDFQQAATTAMISLGQSMKDNISSNLADVITGAKTLKEAFADIASTILTTVIQAIIKMGLEWAATTAMNSLLGKASAVESTATAAATGASITASMAPAAATTSLATAGANTVTASTGMLAFGAVMAAMLGALLAGAFDNGGYIPDGKLGIVGEYGPEIVQGPVAVTGRKTTESILSSAGSKSSAGGNTVVNHITISVTNSGTEMSGSGLQDADYKAMAKSMARIAEEVVIKSKRQGGLNDAGA